MRTYSLGFSHCFPQASPGELLLTRRNAEWVAQSNYSLHVRPTVGDRRHDGARVYLLNSVSVLDYLAEAEMAHSAGQVRARTF